LKALGWSFPAPIASSLDEQGIASAIAALDALGARVATPVQLPHVTVCITHHERPELLKQTIASIEAQGYESFDVVLVDDGSKSAAALAMLDALEPEFAQRSWQIVRQENKYLGAARNTAVRHAKGEYLLFIDDDDCMRDDYIRSFAQAAASSGADVVTCFLEYFEGTNAPSSSTRVHHRWIMPGPIGAGTLVQNTFGGANALVRRALYDRIGGYTEDHGVGFEDWEFYNRALASGAQFEVVPRPLLWCRWGIGGMQASARKHAAQQARASRPAREVMPAAWRELPALVQGLHARNRDLMAHIQKVETELAALRSQSAAVASAQSVSAINEASSATGASSQAAESSSHEEHDVGLPPRLAANMVRRHKVHVWHTEGLGLSGILSWMWRLRDQFAPSVNLDLRLVDLAVLPYGFQQAGSDPSTFYDERVATSQQFLAFLQRTANDVHVVNHAFSYLTSLLEQLGPDVLRGLRLVGVCHTDQEYYYANLEKLAPVLRRIIAVSPTFAETLAKRIPQHRSKIVTLPAWAVQLPEAPAGVRGADEPLRLLYTGRILHFQKRVFDLVELATRLRAAKVNATLTIAGDGPDRVELEKRIRAAGARAIPVTFEPVRPPWEMDGLLKSHHAFVQVSEFEGASVSLMEALAHGLVPAVTVTRSGHDLLESDVNALTAPVGDMKKLTALIALMARDTNRHQRLAAAARATAEAYLADLAYPERFAALVHAVAA
jgi:glycosyltransferase involved in cell wall biosynthesis